MKHLQEPAPRVELSEPLALPSRIIRFLDAPQFAATLRLSLLEHPDTREHSRACAKAMIAFAEVAEQNAANLRADARVILHALSKVKGAR